MSDQLQSGSENSGDFLIYDTPDGHTQIEVRMQDETVWLSQKAMAELFQTTVPNINQHLSSIYSDGELAQKATIKNYLIVQTEGKREVSRKIDHYNLEVIIAVGYRVRSARGTQFRIWATQRLSEFLVKGFTMDDDRLKRGGSGNYFDELLARIRDIRSSERLFWRKVLDIYATSIDYDPSVEASQLFFKTIQNKMHWAAHGHTAAEVVHQRADADKSEMGLTASKASVLASPMCRLPKTICHWKRSKPSIESSALIWSSRNCRPKIAGRCTWPIGLTSSMTSCVYRIAKF